jgi:predicted RNase H-like HicB family nuclease
MVLKVIVHQAEEGGYWAEIPSLPGCNTQGENLEELEVNLFDVIELFFSEEIDETTLSESDFILELPIGIHF